MHCYRVTTFNPGHPTYILRATQQEAFQLARLNTNHHHSPVVALIDLPTDKSRLIEQLNNPQLAIGDAPSMKAWEFVLHGDSAFKHELVPGSGERLADVKAIEKRRAAARSEAAVVVEAKGDAMRAIVEHGKRRTTKQVWDDIFSKGK